MPQTNVCDNGSVYVFHPARFTSKDIFLICCEMPQTNVCDNGSVYVFHPARFTSKDIFLEHKCFRIDYLGYLESQACEHKNNPRTDIRIHSIHFLRLLNQISGHPTKPRRFYFAFTHLRVNGQMSLIPECSGFVTNPEESLLV